MKDNTQHQLGQHYSKEEELVLNYKETLLKQEHKVVIDPFVGEGHLIFFYLNLFTFEKQIELLNNKQVMGFDIFESNISNLKKKIKSIYNIEDEILEDIFKVKDSLLNTEIPENTFIFTNPPYLAKNICKKNYPENFETYFTSKYIKENDYFEIALKKYSKVDGIWIVPSNLFSSDIMSRIRKEIIFNLEEIYIYQKKIFEDTDITVTTFYINKNTNSNVKDIKFVNNNIESIKYEISENGNLSKEWDDIKKIKNTNKVKHGYIDTKVSNGNNKITLLNTKYKNEEYNINDKDYELLTSNILVLRTTDTGTKEGKIGLYTIKEIWGSEAQGLVTKVSSRVYTQLFFNELTKEEQLKLSKDFNEEINRLRKKYNSIFLTNYKNSSNGEQRKRITFKESFSLINKILNK